jgi:hypothetical protein
MTSSTTDQQSDLDPAATYSAGGALARIQSRPKAALWSDDEAMTLVEAVALDVTGGLLSMKGLRTAIKRGGLTSKRINGRIHITKRGVRELLTIHKSAVETRISVAEVEQQEEVTMTDPNADLMARIAAERQRSAEHRGRRPN